MFLKRKDEEKQEKVKYKATYKSLHSENTKTFAITEPTEALASFLQKDGNIWEMYMLTSVIPLSEEEYIKDSF